jgi:hypothetical protein
MNGGDDEINVSKDQENYPISAKIDLSSFAKVILTSTKAFIITREIEFGESAFMFHAKISDPNFKEPLRPMISYTLIKPQSIAK